MISKNVNRNWLILIGFDFDFIYITDLLYIRRFVFGKNAW